MTSDEIAKLEIEARLTAVEQNLYRTSVNLFDLAFPKLKSAEERIAKNELAIGKIKNYQLEQSEWIKEKSQEHDEKIEEIHICLNKIKEELLKCNPEKSGRIVKAQAGETRMTSDEALEISKQLQQIFETDMKDLKERATALGVDNILLTNGPTESGYLVNVEYH